MDGLTTVKAVVVDPTTDAMVWQDYQRHETKQPEKVLEFPAYRVTSTGLASPRSRRSAIFITGSGGMTPSFQTRRQVVQEVNAVCRGREDASRAGSVIELGGQDAKIIVFKKIPETGRKKDSVDERQVRAEPAPHRQDQR
jgi:activator of 2-hydroxyglutaryl-CoA dehydratase